MDMTLSADAVHEQLCQRIEDLEHDKAALADQLERAENCVETLIGAARKTRMWAADNLPAQSGLTVIHYLETGMKEAKRCARKQK